MSEVRLQDQEHMMAPSKEIRELLQHIHLVENKELPQVFFPPQKHQHQTPITHQQASLKNLQPNGDSDPK
jgi:hypothetical protein